MVVTDLHGEGDAYFSIREQFTRLYHAGQVQYLVICGDLIHGYRKPNHDDSVPMLLDLMELQRSYGKETVIMLLGNHELPHIYSVTLAKGSTEFTSRFEHALYASGRRDEALAFLRSLPFVVRTRAGVLITHAGASPTISRVEHADKFLNFDHETVLQLAEQRLHESFDVGRLVQNERYVEQAHHFFAVQGYDDPRMSVLLRGQVVSQYDDDFAFLWETLFTRNEHDSNMNLYAYTLQFFMQAMSEASPYELRVLVSGHIGVDGGHAIVASKQLRVATYAHANPQDDGQFLMLDCGAPVYSVTDLLPQLRYTFD